MPRNVTITFGDGSEHVYNNVPDNVSPDDIITRARSEMGKEVVAVDGGNGDTALVGHVTDTSPAQPESKDGYFASLMRGARNGINPLMDKIDAAEGVLLPKPGQHSVWQGYGIGDAYAYNRDQNLAQSNADKAAHPWAYYPGEIGGAVLNPLNRVGEAAMIGREGLGAMAAGGAISGAAQGAEQGLGSQAQTWGQLGANTALGSLGGAAAGSVLAPVAQGIVRSGSAVADAGSRMLGIGSQAEGNGSRLVALKLAQDNIDPQMAAQLVQEGANNGVPIALADLGDNTRALAGSVSRQPGAARNTAMGFVRDRQFDQGSRIGDAINRDLGPTTDTFAESEALMNRAKAAAGPLYDKAYSNPVEFSDELQAILATPAGKQAMARAATIAANEGRNPTELGFIIDDRGGVSLPSQAGRYSNATIGDVTSGLSRDTVRGWNGADVPKVGPTDLVGFLRRNGGLTDQNGELAHMGIVNNAPRNMDFAGQEHKFGPLLNPNGMTFDDAAFRAWEAGYFPHLSERPDVNEFLDTLRSTYEGRQRAFLPEDMAQIEGYGQAVDNANNIRNIRAETGSPPVVDNSVPAGPRPFAPPESYGRDVPMPTTQTLDYVKRGLDDILEANRSPITGKLQLDEAGRAVNSVKNRLLAEMDRTNPDYAAARQAYAGPASMNSAMLAGKAAVNKSPAEINALLKNMSEPERLQYALGFRSAIAENLGNKNPGANKALPFLAPNRVAALKRVFGDTGDVSRFLDTIQQEGAAHQTYQSVFGNSATAARAVEDMNNSDSRLVSGAADMASAVAGGKTGLIRYGINRARNAFSEGVGSAGQRTREDAAALLFTPSANDFLDALKTAQANAAARSATINGRANRVANAFTGLGALAAGKAASAFNQPTLAVQDQAH